MSDRMRLKDYISQNRSLRRENRQLEIALGLRKEKSFFFRFKCALRLFFQELAK